MSFEKLRKGGPKTSLRYEGLDYSVHTGTAVKKALANYLKDINAVPIHDFSTELINEYRTNQDVLKGILKPDANEA